MPGFTAHAVWPVRCKTVEHATTCIPDFAAHAALPVLVLRLLLKWSLRSQDGSTWSTTMCLCDSTIWWQTCDAHVHSKPGVAPHYTLCHVKDHSVTWWSLTRRFDYHPRCMHHRCTLIERGLVVTGTCDDVRIDAGLCTCVLHTVLLPTLVIGTCVPVSIHVCMYGTCTCLRMCNW